MFVLRSTYLPKLNRYVYKININWNNNYLVPIQIVELPNVQ